MKIKQLLVLDTETSGIDPYKHGLISIGAVDLANPKNQFYGECELRTDAEVSQEAIRINGFTEKEMRDSSKQSVKDLLENFYSWASKFKIKIIAGRTPLFDFNFLKTESEKAGLKFPFHHRTIDLHSIHYAKCIELSCEIPLKDKYFSGLDLEECLKFIGINYERKAHNALEDAKLTAECFARILYGQSLLEEYKQFEIPSYLRK